MVKRLPSVYIDFFLLGSGHYVFVAVWDKNRRNSLSFLREKGCREKGEEVCVCVCVCSGRFREGLSFVKCFPEGAV